jgi:hypothetical protein
MASRNCISTISTACFAADIPPPVGMGGTPPIYDEPAMDRVIGMLLLLGLMYVNARIASNAIRDFVFFRVQEIAL